MQTSQQTNQSVFNNPDDADIYTLLYIVHANDNHIRH